MDKRTQTLVTAGLMVGMLVAALDQTIVDTAFPQMIADLHGGSMITWVLTTYMLASTAVVPVVGKLADIYGRKIFYMLGLTLFVAGSMLCGLSQNMGQLIAFRGFQGIGAGMLMPIVFTIIGDVYPGEKRAKMQGLFGGVWGLASILGPKLGGWITNSFSWRYIFYINLPIGIVAGVLMYTAYRESKGEPRPIDWVGSFSVTAGIVTLLLALSEGGKLWAWDSWQSLTLFGVTAVMLATFIVAERRAAEPVLDLKLFKNRTFTVLNLVGFLMGAGMFGCVFFVPFFIQGVVGVNPNQAGNIMTPMMLTVVVFSILSGRLSLKVPYRYQISLGFALLAVGFYFMTGWTVNTTQFTATWNTMIVGAGLGLIMPILTLALQNAFSARQRGVVTSAATFFRQVGATVGVTVFGTIFNHQMGQQFQIHLADKLAQAGPMLAKVPQAAALMEKAQKDPQVLMEALLRSKDLKGIPQEFLGQFINGVKLMMANSLHIVFLCAIGVMVVGFVTVQFLGNVSLKRQAAENGGEIHLEPSIAME